MLKVAGPLCKVNEQAHQLSQPQAGVGWCALETKGTSK